MTSYEIHTLREQGHLIDSKELVWFHWKYCVTSFPFKRFLSFMNRSNVSSLKILHYKFPNYRVSHSKESKVILLWWGDRFWFLLIFRVLRVHEKGTFMLNSSVFIFLMWHALYRMICKNAKLFFGKNSLNVSNVKLISKFSFQHFWLFYAFLVRMTACTLHIKWFPWH